MARRRTIIIDCVLVATVLVTGCTCPRASMSHGQVMESCAVSDAEALLEVAWSIPSVELSETNTLGFRLKDNNGQLFRSQTLNGMTEDWHGTGRLHWSLSPAVSTNGVNLTLQGRWRSSKLSGQAETAFLAPFTGGVDGRTTIAARHEVPDGTRTRVVEQAWRCVSAFAQT
jgi:hypothetical protein